MHFIHKEEHNEKSKLESRRQTDRWVDGSKTYSPQLSDSPHPRKPAEWLRARLCVKQTRFKSFLNWMT